MRSTAGFADAVMSFKSAATGSSEAVMRCALASVGSTCWRTSSTAARVLRTVTASSTMSHTSKTPTMTNTTGRIVANTSMDVPFHAERRGRAPAHRAQPGKLSR